MLHAAARVRVAFLVALSIPIRSDPAFAGEVPETAWSVSLGMPPLLVDHPALTALFPQRLVEQPRQLFGWQMGEFGTVAVGAITPLGGHAVALALSQEHQPLTTRTQRQQLQMAVGIELGRFDLGVAVRGFDDTSQQSNLTTGGSSTSNEDIEQRFSFLEGALGIEVEAGGAMLDISAEFRDEDSQRDVTYWTSGVIASSTGRASATRSAFRFAARGETPLDAETRAVAGVVVQTGDRTWSGSTSGANQPWTEFRALDDEVVWEGGVALARTLESAAEISVFVYRDAVRGADLLGENRIDSVDRVSTLLGASWRGDLLPRTQLLLGVGISRTTTRNEARVASADFQADQASETRILSERFSWGVTHAWRAMRLAGAMRSTLDLDDFFFAVDAGLVF